MTDLSKIGFLVYLSRSGSTLLSRLLDGFDDVCVTTEGELPLELFGVKSYAPINLLSKKEKENYLSVLLKHSKLNTWGVNPKEIISESKLWDGLVTGPEIIRVLLSGYKQHHKPEAKIVIYKASPLMPWHVKETLQHFPDLKIIHLIRDPRAVYNSQKVSVNPYENRPFSTSPITTAIDWQRSIKESASFSNSRIHIVRYEDIVENTDNTLYDIINFLGVSNSSEDLGITRFEERIPESEKILHRLVKQTPDKRRLHAWQSSLSEKEKMYIDVLLGDILDTCRYERNYYFRDLNLFQKCVLWFEKIYIRMKILFRRLKRISRTLINHPGYFYTRLQLKLKP